ncbi:MAG: hypothetical protein QOI18_303 [Solirubrobacteraceae bacterium]|jgi:hypothetical protein|nr:hypothetical protein [Solirubrobacteraceae bacterium]MEA2333559.1 hypothetical protein [Solirubrobacteraceae bacterium]
MPVPPSILRRRRHAPRALLAVALTGISVVAGACGSSRSEGTSIDPANAVPASAALYAGAVVRPEGSLQAAARSAGQTLTHQADPYLRLLGALQTPGSGALDFKRDVAPWLGLRAGAFLSATATGSSEDAVGKLLALVQRGLLGQGSSAAAFPFAAHSTEGAIVLDTRDTAKARSFLRMLAGRAGARTASYRGVAYQATPSGIAFGIVARLAVIGTEAALHAVIDTSSGGPALARAPSYSKLLAAAPAGALAHIYADPRALSGAKGSAAQGSSTALSLLAGGRALNVSLVPSKSSISIDADTLRSGGGAGGLLASSAQAAGAMGELPGESWLAVGLGDVGGTLGRDPGALAGIASLAGLLTGSGAEQGQAAGISITGLLAGILKPLRELGGETGQARRELTSWMGSAGLFASGAGLLELKGGIAIESKDSALSRAAVAKLGAKLRKGGGSVQSASIPGTDAALAVRLSGLPVVLYIANGRDANGKAKFVMGIGEASIETALHPSSSLSGAAAYGTASAVLGGAHPSVIVDFPTLLGLLEGIGLSEDPTIAPFVPYLRSLTTLSGGGAGAGSGIERLRLVLGLQQTG